jgi:uncharacterized membrane protein YuzA (DUF378 family)
MKTLDIICVILLIVGGLNWALIGIFSWNVVAAIFGDMATLSRIIYIIVGIAALYQLIGWKAMQRRWGKATVTA